MLIIITMHERSTGMFNVGTYDGCSFDSRSTGDRHSFDGGCTIIGRIDIVSVSAT
jgi:hypothetical protein